MPFKASSEGISLDDEFVIPDDEYVLEIVKAKEGLSKDGLYQQVIVDFKVAEGQRKNFPVNYHYVTFKKAGDKGAGMAIKFLKTIGQPWEGDFTVDASKWVGAKLVGYLSAEEYNGKKNMKCKWVKPVDTGSQVEKDEAMEEVPF